MTTDCAYCFPCRMYGVNPSTPKFCIEGYNDWKHALDGWSELGNVEKDASKKNAKYLSPDIQNEIVDIMAQLVRDAHSANIKAAEFFTIMVDGTTDKTNEEIHVIVVLYLDPVTQEIEERALDVDSTKRSAKDIFEFVRKTLEDDCEIGFGGLVSQRMMEQV